MLNKKPHTVRIGDRGARLPARQVGESLPTFIVAEIGINHNGSLEIAKRLIDAAKAAGCDAVKFQKRTPQLHVSPAQKDTMRQTPWGYISYLEYRKKIEFGLREYKEIDRYCARQGISWFASCWDTPSVDFLEQFDPICYKVPSAMLTDGDLLAYVRKTGRPIMLSTGMSSMAQVTQATKIVGTQNLILLHCTSTYPCSPEDLNLRMVQTLAHRFHCPVGYSGHEVGLSTTVAAVALGACVVERHMTLDRAMWGTDQAASVEPGGFARLVKDIRVVEKALGDGVKKVYESERTAMQRLRRV